MSRHGPVDERVDDLLVAWEESRAAGAPLSAVELCRECPELVEQVEQEIVRLKTVDRFLYSAANVAHGEAGALRLGGQNVAAAPDTDFSLRPVNGLPGLPGFELLEELGRGGMGVVYKARQKSLGRFVAVKTLAGSRWAQPASAARLRKEAQALSRLKHPHVVQVLDVVETPHALSIVLEYVAGQSLAQRLAGGPLPADEAARLALSLARALAAVHAEGILHRDIKPGNVLLGRAGEIKISDFGLAKESGSHPSVTVTGDLLGSPSYMAPEQAQGRTHDIDVRTDIYALGATLYEMLSGRPPFQAASHAETLKQVIETDPVSPRLVNPGVPRDLETICLRCLEKSPGLRFPAANELADELDRYLRGEPIRSRPIGAAQRLVRWSRRRPATAASIGVAVLAVLAVAAALVIRDRELARFNFELTRLNADLEASTAAARQAQRAAEASEGRAQDSLYAADVNRAATALRETDTRALSELLERHVPAAGATDRRGFEWWYLYRQTHLPHAVLFEAGSPLYILCLCPERRILAVAGKDAVVRLIDTQTNEPVREIVTGQVEVNGVAFSPDGKELATAGDDGSIRLWDLATGAERLKIDAHPEKAFQVAFTPDGTKLVSCGDNPVIRVFDSRSGDELTPLVGHTRTVESVVLSHDGRLAASASADGTARTWEIATGQQRNGLAAGPGQAPIVLAEQRDLLITGGRDGRLRTWSLSKNSALGSASQRDGIKSLALDPAGKTLAAGDASGSIRLWALAADGTLADEAFRSWHAHRGNVESLLWSPDGARLLSTGADGRVVSWSLADAARQSGPDVLAIGKASTFCLVPGTNSLIVLARRPDTLVRWNWATGQEEARLPGETPYDAAAVSPDGKWIALRRSGRVISVHAVAEVCRRPPHETLLFDWDPGGKLGIAEFGPDSRSVAVPFVRDRTDGQQYAWEVWLHGPPNFGQREPVPVSGADRAVFAPDGKTIALITDARLVLYDLLRKAIVWEEPQTEVSALAFSPDGKLLITAGGARTIVVRNAADGTIRDRLTGHRARIACAVFSPDGRTLASGSEDGTIKLWHVAAGQELFELRGAEGSCARLEFSADGRRLLALDWRPEGDAIAVFDARAGK